MLSTYNNVTELLEPRKVFSPRLVNLLLDRSLFVEKMLLYLQLISSISQFFSEIVSRIEMQLNSAGPKVAFLPKICTVVHLFCTSIIHFSCTLIRNLTILWITCDVMLVKPITAWKLLLWFSFSSVSKQKQIHPYPYKPNSFRFQWNPFTYSLLSLMLISTEIPDNSLSFKILQQKWSDVINLETK